MKERIGVYVCHCGGNISDYVDVKELSRILTDENGIAISKDVMFACADSSQKDMVNDIIEHKLDAIVVASCSPKLHLHTFKGVANRAGLNPSNYVQVNIREQCSWPHSDKPDEATVKALGLIRAGIKRVSHSESLQNNEISVKKSVLIIGAGVAGMKAAINMAQLGIEVYLIEKDYYVGGNIVHYDHLFMSGQNGKDLIASLYNQIKSYNNITLFTGANIEKVSGSLGNFNIDISIRPRYFSLKNDTSPLISAMNECDIWVEDPFNFGLTKRKAIYKNYPEALPDIPVVDAETLKNHPEFVEKHKPYIDLNQQNEHLTLSAGSIMVTTGFDHYKPKEGEYGYAQFPEVVSLSEFKKIMALNPSKLSYNNKEVKSVAFIYCVGNRQSKGENKYCSRTCCSSAILTSLRLKESYKNITAYHLFRDIRTYGKQELLYEQSSKQGDIYIRFDEKEPPVVEKNKKNLNITVKDYLTAKTELQIECDMIVLVTGMIPRDDSTLISEKLKIPIGNDKFFNEIHPKLKPVETVIKGVYISGACQGPKNISESVQSSLSAAAKINAMLKKGSISLDPIIARINADTCTWCGKCAEVCEYGAINEVESGSKTIASVNKATCTGCGICAPVCPVNAIEIAQFTDLEIEGMIDGFMDNTQMPEKVQEETTQEPTQTLGMRKHPDTWKTIMDIIKDTKKTIPEIAQESGIDKDIITYNLMTMNKFNMIQVEGMDNKKVYYYYKLKSI